MRKKIFILIILVLSIAVIDCNAQNNIHYSQFYNAPQLLNPALAGQFDDLYRLNGHTRKQWSGTSGDANYLYEMTSGGVDFSLFRRKLGLGLYGLQDNAGGGIFNTLKFFFSSSYSFILGDNILSFGIQPMMSMSSLDRSKLDPLQVEQFNPSVSYFDVNSGINYLHDFGFFEANLGVSAMNLIQAKEQFAKSGVAGKVPTTYKANLNIDWELTDNLKCMPGGIFMMQSGSKNIVFGSNFSYKVYNNISIIGGLWGRTNTNNFESLIPKVGLKIGKTQAMISYDYNTTFTNGADNKYFDQMSKTFELSLIWTGRPKVLPPLLEDVFLLNPRF